MRRSIPVVLLTCVWLGGLAGNAAEPAAERLLLGFEEAEVQQWAGALKVKPEAGKTKDGTPFVSFKTSFASDHWRLFKGQASQGDFAMGLARLRTGDDLPLGFPVPREAQRYYGVFRDNWAAGAWLNTCGVFRRLLPMDWSAHDRLRLDVYCEDVAQTVRVQLEDEESAPPVVRNFVVKPGQWTTLEIDLRDAAKARKLDLKRMATLVVAVVKADGKVTKNPSAWLDNLRLSSAQTPAKLPVLRDDSPHDLPELYQAKSKPTPERLPAGQPDRSPLAGEKPIVIPLDKASFGVTPVGWAAAYDNQRLLLGFCDPTNAFVIQSRDGGKTWTGLDGAAKATLVPTKIANGCIDHQAGRGDPVGQRGDVVLFSNMGCNGQVLSSLRYFSQKLTFTGQGWELQKTPALVDADLRHCSSNQSVIRTADGRLWAAYGLVGRLGTNHINVRYSDDDGLTWKASREGTSGVIPGTIVSDQGGVGFGYSFDEPCLVPFGRGVACIWEEYGYGSKRNQLLWSRFDGEKWSAIEEVPAPPRAGLVWCRPHLHAVSIDGKEIVLASGFRKAVLAFRDGQWRQEPIEVPFGGRVSLAGKTVLVVAVSSETTDPRKGPMVIRAWQRGADGKWTGPRLLAREEEPIAGMEGLNVLRPGLVVQAYAPANFVPIAWNCKGQKWIKYLRVAVE